jgi:hypothetical protein
LPVVTDYLDDFSGGEQDHISSLEFEENQWMDLVGFVFDNQRRLRSQWSGAEWSAEVTEDLSEESS